MKIFQHLSVYGKVAEEPLQLQMIQTMFLHFCEIVLIAIIQRIGNEELMSTTHDEY